MIVPSNLRFTTNQLNQVQGLLRNDCGGIHCFFPRESWLSSVSQRTLELESEELSLSLVVVYHLLLHREKLHNYSYPSWIHHIMDMQKKGKIISPEKSTHIHLTQLPRAVDESHSFWTRNSKYQNWNPTLEDLPARVGGCKVVKGKRHECLPDSIYITKKQSKRKKHHFKRDIVSPVRNEKKQSIVETSVGNSVYTDHW